jgi:hypothetical protein
MRRRPLLRAAAVGGGAYMAGKSRARSQERESEQEQRLGQLESQQPAAAPPPAAPAAPAAAGPTADTIERLKQLGQLHEQGVLTDAEFQSQKALLLGG